MENYYYQIKNIVSGLETNKIAIIGKGPSIRQCNKNFDDFIVINLNDSEIIFPGHFSIFHSSWAYQSIKSNGFQAKYYFSDLTLSENIPHQQVSYMPDTYDSSETMIERIRSERLYVEDFLLISAVKLAFIIAQQLDRKMEVFMLGFDFSTAGGESPMQDLSYHDQDFKSIFLRTQEQYFLQLKDYFDKREELISITHVGSKAYSDITVNAFNKLELLRRPRKDSGLPFDQITAYQELLKKTKENHVIVVAEFTNNHIGDPERLVKMIELAKDAGADMIKVQKRSVDTFYTNDELNSAYKSPFGKTLADYRRGVELNEALFNLIDDECKKNEIIWFSSILDRESYDYMLSYRTPLIKLPSTISNHRNYLKHVADTYDGDIVISTGFTDQQYEQFVLDYFTDESNLFLLQCTSSYPTPPEACQISVVRHYHDLKEKHPNIIPGYSSHDVGSLGCMLAVAAGAKMVEKHVKLGDLDWIHFDAVAIDLYNNGFKNFVKDIRKAERMCGSEKKQIHVVEHHKYMPNKQAN